MSATLEDVAKRAKCSPATVSRVVNRVGQVSDTMRKRVLRIAKDLGYLHEAAAEVQETWPVAKRPRGGTPAVGYLEIVLHRHSPFEPFAVDHGRVQVSPLTPSPTGPELVNTFRSSDSFYRGLVDGMIDEAARWGYQAILQPNSNWRDAELLDGVHRSEKAGVLLTGEYSPDLDAFVAACRKPLVLADLISDAGPPVVTTDNARGIASAFIHIRGLGHQRIGFAGGPPDVAERTGRHPAYQWQMAASGQTVNPAWVFTESPHMVHVAAWAREALARKDRPTAILCQNDFVALAVVQAAQQMGLNVPRDLSVTGYDDLEVASLLTPPLTSVHVPTQDLGRLAVQELMLQISTKGRGRPLAQRISVPPKLVVRASTGPV
jgi:DNA-binding LacI/PurR family transcriptional regulator